MRIAVIGQAAFGADVLKGLIERGQEVVGVFCPPDRGSKVDPIKAAAQAAGIRVFQPGHMRDPEAYEAMVSLAPDLGLLAFVTDIVPPKLFNVPKLGSIEYHPSLLPKYRGSSAINWAVINGEKETGLSIFWLDEGIGHRGHPHPEKGGDRPQRNHREVYFNKLYPLGCRPVWRRWISWSRARPPDIPGSLSVDLRSAVR